MEDIKTKATLHEPDIRRAMFVIMNSKTGENRPIRFEDIEARVNDIPLPQAAPEEVRDLLVTAKNLLLYSWYYYPFSMSASLQAAAALEQALRLRLNATNRDTLSFLLKSALKQNLLIDEGFPRWKAYNEAFAELHPMSGHSQEMHYAAFLAENLPRFRNTLAHGNRFVNDSGFHDLDVVCEAIEQLYPSASVGS